MRQNQLEIPRRRNLVDGLPERKIALDIIGGETRKTPPETRTSTTELRVAPWLLRSGRNEKSTPRLGLLHRWNRDARPYGSWLEQFGKIRMVMPDEFREDIDILILPGGPDLSPKVATHISAQAGQVAPEWLEFYPSTLQQYVESGTRIFGICLGFQMLTAYFGGTLYGHIPEHDMGRHLVNVEDKWLKKLGIDEPIQMVNSRHHQTIYSYPAELLPLSWSLSGEKKDWKGKTPKGEDKCLLEAWVHSVLPIAGVQWHPEDITHKPESYYAKKYGYCIGDIISNATINFLLNLTV